MRLLDRIIVRFGRIVLDAYRREANRILAANGSEGRVTAGVDLRHPENIYIGEGSYVNGGMLAASKDAKIVIGKDCMVSYAVHMRTDTHRYDRTDVPMIDQGHDEADIIIGDDVWVGYGAQIMAGVNVGSHSIVGAGAIVTHDVPEWTVVGGVPAKQIKVRRQVENG